MKGYLEKIATGPRMSKDLTEEEAEDALTLVLNNEISPVRAGVFLIAARMKLETVPENLGYWKAMHKITHKHSVPFEKLLQVADPFDGFNRSPYFGFYTLPVMAAMGLPAYGHSTLGLPPKFGITFENLLIEHYRFSEADGPEKRLDLLKEFRFGFLSTRQTHPALENLRGMRIEIIKRTMLSTLEKMLMPVEAKAGGNFLATSYFHKGYEHSMMAVANISPFDRTIIGNGMEGTTLYGVHKPAEVFIDNGNNPPEEKHLTLENMFDRQTSDKISGSFKELKKERAELASLAQWGEAALKNNKGPAGTLTACQAATLCHLFGMFSSPQKGFNTARDLLQNGTCYESLMRYIEKGRGPATRTGK